MMLDGVLDVSKKLNLFKELDEVILFKDLNKILEYYNIKLNFISGNKKIIEREEDNNFIIKIPENIYIPQNEIQYTGLERVYEISFYTIHSLFHILNGDLDNYKDNIFIDTWANRKNIDVSDEIELRADLYTYLFFINNNTDRFKSLFSDGKYESYILTKERQIFLNGFLSEGSNIEILGDS